MRKGQLDEMQRQIRDRIGNQMFILMSYLLLLDIGLYGFGFRWLSYPMNVFVIMIGCMCYYLARIIWQGAYAGPNAKRTGLKVVIINTVTALIAALIVWFVNNHYPAASPDDSNGAMVLFIFGGVALIIISVVSLCRRRNNKGQDD